MGKWGQTNNAVTRTTQYGIKKSVEVFIVGPSGREGIIEVVWMMKNGRSVWELITAMPRPFV